MLGSSSLRFVIDRIVDPDKYIVGPGDELHINIISSNETFDHSLVISPTGQLLIPSAGMVNCNKLKLSQLVKEIKKEITIIGVGGVCSGITAYEKMTSGASLLQLYTGMVYEGPGIIKKIKSELIDILKKEKNEKDYNY